MIANRSAQWAVAALAASVGLALATASAQAQQLPRVNWKMQSAFGSQLPHLGHLGGALRQGHRAR